MEHFSVCWVYKVYWKQLNAKTTTDICIFYDSCFQYLTLQFNWVLFFLQRNIFLRNKLVVVIWASIFWSHCLYVRTLELKEF